MTSRGGVPPGHPPQLSSSGGVLGDQILRHVPVDAGHGNCLGAHHGVVDNVIDGVRTDRAEVLMHQEIAGAVVVEIADATHADVRASLGDSGGAYNCIGLYCEHLERSHLGGRTMLMHQDIGGAVVVEVARAVYLPASANCPQRWGGLHHIVAHYQGPQRHRSISEINLMLQDVDGSIPIDVVGAIHVPVDTVHIEGDVRLHRVVVHYHHFKGALAACAACVPMHQDVVGAIVVEVAHGVHDPIGSAHGDLDLSLDPTRVHLIDEKGSRPV